MSKYVQHITTKSFNDSVGLSAQGGQPMNAGSAQTPSIFNAYGTANFLGLGNTTATSATMYVAPNSTTHSSGNYYYSYFAKPITTGSTTGSAYTLYIQDAPNGATNTYSLYINTGLSYFGGQIISGVTTGTAPLSVFSTTTVANLSANYLGGSTFAIPSAIGSTTPNTGAFTTLSASGLITGTSGLTISSGTSALQAITASGLITGTNGLTISSGTSALQTITGTSITASGLINGTSGLTISSGTSALQAITGTSISVTGQLTSTVSQGTAPLSVASTTTVANLSANYLGGNTFATPSTIGSTTPNTGAFTTLSASGLITGIGGLTISSGTSSLQTITGTSITASGLITGSNGLTISSGTSALQSITGTGISVTGQLTSTVAQGTAPLSVASTTTVTNLSANYLGGNTFSSPSAIGNTTPSTGAFTTLSVSGVATYTGIGSSTASSSSLYIAPATTTASATSNMYFTYLTAPAMTLASGAVINAYTKYIAGSPTISGGGTITNSYALYVNSGLSYFGGALNVNGQLTSTVSQGTAPFIITSTTTVANLSAGYLGGNTFASPATIGSISPNTGAFTTLSASGLITGNLGLTVATGQTLNVGTTGTTSPLNAYGLITGTNGLTISSGVTSLQAVTAAGLITGNSGLTISTGTTTLSGTVNLSALTVSTTLQLDGSKNITSLSNIGTGSNVLATSPTFTTSMLLNGTSSGTITMQATTGTYNFNYPITSGLAGQYLASGGGLASPMTWINPGNLTTRIGIGGYMYNSSSAVTITASGSSSTISGTVLTIGGSVSGVFTIGMVLTGTGVQLATYITSYGTGTGGAGTYNISLSQTVSSATSITGTLTNSLPLTLDTKVINKRLRTSRASVNTGVSTWITRTAPSTLNWSSVCWSPELGIFVAGNAASNTNMMSSTDGITWTARTGGSTGFWNSICWSPELKMFVAVAASTSTTSIMYSFNGTTWTTVTNASASFLSVCWSAELNLFVAIGQFNYATSSTGVGTWTIGSTPASLQAVCWSAELQLFVSMGTAGTLFYYSSNGTSWTATSFSDSATYWISVCWSPELYLFVAVGSTTPTGNTSSNFAVSSDGINWSIVKPGIAIADMYQIIWCNELGIFVAAGVNSIMTSSDGTNWVSRNTAYNLHSIAYSPELSILVAPIYNTATVASTNPIIPASKSALLVNPSYVSVNNSNGQITSSVATGTAPLVVASTTNVANLNASSLGGATFSAPGAIGGGTPSTGAFTTGTYTSNSDNIFTVNAGTYTPNQTPAKFLSPSLGTGNYATVTQGVAQTTNNSFEHRFYNVGAGLSSNYYALAPLNGSPGFTLTASGIATFPINIASTSITTGTVVFGGGLGASGNGYFGGTLNCLTTAVIGNQTASVSLQLADTATNAWQITTGSGNLTWNNGTFGGTYISRMQLSSSGTLTVTGDVSSFGTISDRRLKTNIVNLDTTSSLNIVKSLNI
jgi:hypothetical protein